ncbi:unnamed protein product [Sphagnum balticum]
MTSVVRNVGASFSSNSLLQLSMSDQFCCDRLCVQRSPACCLGTLNPKLLRDMSSGSASCVDFGGSSSLVGGWFSSSSSSSWGARRFGIQVRCSAPPPVAMPTTTSPHRPTSPKTRTQGIMEGISSGNEAGGAGGSSSYQALKRMDEQWLRMRSMKPVTGPAPEVVQRHQGSWLNAAKTTTLEEPVFDMVVCGGTLGVFLATTLALRGFKVALIEKGPLRGREQDWNVSRKELQELVKEGVITEDEVDQVISIEFNPSRVAFEGGTEIWVTDILNLGVSPAKLIDISKSRFLKAGGVLFEYRGLSKVDVFDNGAVVSLDDGTSLVSQLVVDVMGNASPIVRQIRWGERPDGVCLVVGTCARGFVNNTASDLIYTHTPVTKVGASKTQYFWEAFPAGSGPRDRTTYMFTYLDATPSRPSLEQMLEDYWDLMPSYQEIKLEDLKILRVLFGCFPTYRSSPLPAAFDRVLQVGDASGIQSPISFGGFGAIIRHLGRLSNGVAEALEADMLDRRSLALLNPYLPNLSAVWMYQRAMSVRLDIKSSPHFINTLLSVNFQCMQRLGDPVLRPFLQDVVQFGPQVQLLTTIMLTKPLFIPQILRQVGIFPLFDWVRHFIALATYTILWLAAARFLSSWVKSLPEKKQYRWRRHLEAWQYGSGLDYHP